MNNPSVVSASNSTTAQLSQNQALVTMTSLFFIWGFITALNDILIPHLKAAFDLSYVQAMLVQFAFFGAYFIVSPIAGRWIASRGYIQGAVTGLLTIACGCGIFYPAAAVESYPLFLVGLFVLASGVTILQVAANPYVANLGEAKTSASRLNLAQAINSLGHTLAPWFGAILIFSATNDAQISPQSVQLPYLLIAATMIITAISFKFINLPEIDVIGDDKVTNQSQGSIWSQRHLVLGAIAIFLYVGAEVSIGSFLVNYFQQLSTNDINMATLDAQTASKMVSYYWGAAMMGRFVGALLTRFISPAIVLAVNAVLAVVLLLITITTTGLVAMYSVIAVGFFNAIMFPTIFSLAIKNLGPLTARGSGLLCQAIVGGAILPLIQALVADSWSVQLSFMVPMLSYLYIIGYGFIVHTANKGAKS